MVPHLCIYPNPGIYWKEMKSLPQSVPAHPYLLLHYSQITTTWKQHKWSSVNEWIMKMWYIYMKMWDITWHIKYLYINIDTWILLSHFFLKKEILPFVTWMYLECIVLNEISHTEKDKHCMISYIIWNL